jgi:hypothetical protein
MSFFEDASLVYIPAAIKNGKTYSIKPTDGTGDLTFTRASSATRVGPNGYIEKVRTNATQYSQEFDNAAWFPINVTRTANAGTAPDGTTTADKIIPSSSSNNKMLYNQTGILSSVGEYSMSVYVKAAGYSKVGLRESESVGFYATFDLSNGTILDSSSDQVNTITSVGDGWYRITSTRSFTGGVSLGIIPLDNSYTSGQPFSYSYAGDGTSGILAWGAQTEHGVPTEYIKTEAAAVSVGPVSGTPRLDYLGSDCGRLLLEPQRSNLFTYSEQLNNAAWSKNNITITANAATSPDGYMNADKMQDSTSGAIVTYMNQNPATSGTQYTSSGFFKKAEYNFVLLHAFGLGGAVFNLNTGVLVSQSGGTGTITSYGDGWYRCTYTFTATGGGVFFTQTPTGSISYTGTAGSGIYAYGLQVEAAAQASSYVPTLGTAVTRVADLAQKTSVSALIGQTEGTIFFEGAQVLPLTCVPFQLSNGTNNNRAQIEISGTGAPLCVISSGGTTQAVIVGSAYAVGQDRKIAITYKANEFKLYQNGVLVGSDTSGSAPVSLSQINIGSEVGTPYLGFNVKQLLHFKTALTEAQAIELTTL